MVMSSPSKSLVEEVAEYELAIDKDSSITNNYWWLGISYLLQGDEAAAQATWFAPISEAVDESAVSDLIQELTAAIEVAVGQQIALGNYDGALLLRQHLQSVDPGDVNNALKLILLSESCEQLVPELLTELGLDSILAETDPEQIDQKLFAAVWEKLLLVIDEDSVAAIMACLDYSDRPEQLALMAVERGILLMHRGWPELAIDVLTKCLEYQPQNFDALQYLSLSCSKIKNYQQSIEFAKQSYTYALNHSVQRQFKSAHTFMLAMMEASEFAEITSFIEPYRDIIKRVLVSYQSGMENLPSDDLAIEQCKTIMAFALCFFPYLEDQPAQTHDYLNQAGVICQKNLPPLASTPAPHSHQIPKPVGTLRIGYIAATLSAHSVGWLSRWLWHHHDHEQFQIFTYCVGTPADDAVNNQWFRDKSHATYYFEQDVAAMVAQIRSDQIDILVELDSITSVLTYMVMAHKPAPVQISWLGWDAAGSPAIDYFIADPYVLPADAQDYYAEKIWRLPHTYVAVDGFEVGTPTLRREDLGIAPDAVVFFSAQIGYKLHLETIRLQMQILQQVPGSHLLVKARTQDVAVSRFYQQMAADIGIDFSRLHFLGKVADEETHRANLQIADVMLDSFPYNGATTTLETLWLGIPLVTRVGEQFAARNSYGFMMNVGVTEGIAWTAAEYVDWGIRLGSDSAMRQQIMGKLLDARSKSPLWNGQQFTREMEKAYRAMWEGHLSR